MCNMNSSSRMIVIVLYSTKVEVMPKKDMQMCLGCTADGKV